MEFEKRYKHPEKYKIAPNTRIIQPFGLWSEGRLTFNRGVFFSRKGQLRYQIYSPIEADSFSYDYKTSCLTLNDSQVGISILIYGIRSLFLSAREQHVPRGTLVGEAFQIKSCTPGVYVECIITELSLLEKLKGRFDPSEDKLDTQSKERKYIKELELSKHDVSALKYEQKISEFSFYHVIQREEKRRPYKAYFNYSAIFC